MKKRLFLITFILTLISSFIVRAEEESLWTAFNEIGKVLSLDMTNIGANAYAFKLAMFFVIFIVLLVGASFIFKDNKKYAGFTAFFLALPMAWLIPNEAAISIFTTYYSITLVIFSLAPIGIGMFIKHKFLTGEGAGNDFMSGLIFILSAWIFKSFTETMESGNVEVFGGLGTFATIAYILCYIIGIWYLISMFRGGPTGVGKAAEKAGDVVGDTKKTNRKIRRLLGRGVDRTLSAFIRDNKESENIEKLNEKTEETVNDIDAIISAGQIKSSEVNSVKRKVLSIISSTKTNSDYFRRINRTTYRQQTGIGRAIEAFNKVGKDFNELKALEGNLLLEHKAAKDALLDAHNYYKGNPKSMTQGFFTQAAALEAPWPKPLTTNVTFGGTTLTLLQVLNNTKASLLHKKPKIEEAVDHEAEAKTILDGILVETRKIIKELEE